MGPFFHTTTDSEVIAFHIARERVHSDSVEEAVLKTARKLKGAYGLVIMSPRKLIGVRDPYGLKPLCIGKEITRMCLLPKSCALNSVGAEFVRDVEPGEMVIISREGIRSNRELAGGKKLHIVYLNIFTLPGLTAFWTELEFMMPVSGVENLLQGPIRWRRIWLPAFRIPAFRRQKATQRNLEFPFGLAFYKNQLYRKNLY
mgnify:CR=1 FL=1